MKVNAEADVVGVEEKGAVTLDGNVVFNGVTNVLVAAAVVMVVVAANVDVDVTELGNLLKLNPPNAGALEVLEMAGANETEGSPWVELTVGWLD